MKLSQVTDGTGVLTGHAFYCPGCGFSHVFYTSGQLVWAFDNNLEFPTFSPSLLNTCPNHPDPKQRRCHLNLTAGKIHYHGDCTHDLVGEIVDLPEFQWSS